MNPYQSPQSAIQACPSSSAPALRLRVSGLLMALSALGAIAVLGFWEGLGGAGPAWMLRGDLGRLLSWSPPPLLALVWLLIGSGLLWGAPAARRAARAMPLITALCLCAAALLGWHSHLGRDQIALLTLLFSTPALALPLQVFFDSRGAPPVEPPALLSDWTWAWLHAPAVPGCAAAMVFWGWFTDGG